KEAEAARVKAEAEAAKAAAKAEAAKARAETEKQASKPAEKKQAKASDAFTPLESPPSSLSGSKEARLAELLQLYKADKITPREYHIERAKIIAGP
ncbi:MAG TPA: hypothetical protein VI136_23205, partial [Verrucomicrobiae bacterium]